jgi:hypothetical protein
MKNDFDPLAYMAQLKQVRVPEDQAQVHARALDAVASHCVSAQDLARVEKQFQAENQSGFAVCVAKIDALAAEFHEFKISVEHRFEGNDKRFEGVDKRFDGIDHRLDALEAGQLKLVERISKLETEMRYHRWVLGLIVSMNIGILLKLFFP